MTLYYHAFFGPQTPKLTGQQNLASAVRELLGSEMMYQDLAPTGKEAKSVPKFFAIARKMIFIALIRGLKRQCSGDITVVDMVHSLATLDNKRARDRLIVLGHDSYALRAWRDFKASRLSVRKARLLISWIGWRFIEVLLRHLAWRVFFVSPIDSRNAIGSSFDNVLAIPISANLCDAGARLRTQGQLRRGSPRILVSLPVTNFSQSVIDLALVSRLLDIASSRAEITLWGKGAAPLCKALNNLPSSVRIVEWVENYTAFVASFDVLVYPRMVGSGFHTKLAEALVLGVPCVCVDWVATPLSLAGYDGITTFKDSESFSRAIAEFLDVYDSGGIQRKPAIPAKSAAREALAPLTRAILQAMKEQGSPK